MIKICSRCNKEKTGTVENFGRNKSKPDCLQCWCKECQRDYNRKNYRKNSSKACERAKKYYNSNKKKVADQQWKRRAQKKRRAERRKGFDDFLARAVWDGPPVKIYTEEERHELEIEIRSTRPEDIPKGWYNSLPDAAKKWLNDRPDVKKVLRSSPKDTKNFHVINKLRRDIFQYRHLKQWQIDEALFIGEMDESSDKVR